MTLEDAASHVLLARHNPRLGSIHSVERIVLTVPDLDEADRFFATFGLRCERKNALRLDVGTFHHSHVWMTLLLGPVKKLQYITFAIHEPDYAAMVGRIKHERLCAPHPLANRITGDAGTWLEAPDGLAVQVLIGEKSSPAQKCEPTSLPVTLLGTGAAPSRSRAGVVRPRHLSHILLFTSDVDQAIDFYVRKLGLRLSDRSGSDIAFLHGAYGSDHHMVAFVRSEGPGIHHTSWDVGSVHEVGLGAQQMRSSGFDQGWGLGRHVLGSNFFHYVRDPWGSYAEYSFDMDYVPTDFDWPAADHPREDSFYVWGPQPPDDFATNYERDCNQSSSDVDSGKLN